MKGNPMEIFFNFEIDEKITELEVKQKQLRKLDYENDLIVKKITKLLHTREELEYDVENLEDHIKYLSILLKSKWIKSAYKKYKEKEESI